MNRLTATALSLVAALVALVPLYGDPRQTPVTHSEWARMLVRALGMDEVVRASTTASRVFSALSWKQSLAFPAAEYQRGDGVERVGRRVDALEIGGEVAYPLAVVRGGDYKVRLRLRGDPANPVQAEVARVGETAPLSVFTVIPASVEGWIDAGTTHLDPGNYTASVLLPSGSALDYVEFAPPCLRPIEPYSGWQPTAVALTDDVAVTAVQALDREWDLPPADLPIEVDGGSFQTLGGPSVIPAAATPGTLDQMLWLRAGAEGLQAVVFVDLPVAGLYTVSVFGIEGGGQSWMGDACTKAVICAGDPLEPRGPEWRILMTSEFAAGQHFFAVTLLEGAAIGKLRLERKKTTSADYLAAMERICFNPGPEGEPIAREKAVEAMQCVERRRSESPQAFCGDVELPPEAGPGGGAGSEVAGPGAAPPSVIPPGGGRPIPGGGMPPLTPPQVPPDIPTQPPASPVLPH